MHPSKCPCCQCKWRSDETITEFFTRKYEVEGVPQYIIEKGITNPVAAAVYTGEFYGDTPETPRYFGINILAMEDGSYDGVSWWGCTKCGARVNRFTHKIEVKNEYSEMLINYGKEGVH